MGTELGPDDGSLVGAGEGRFEGAAVGARVGLEDGTDEGCSDGTRDGRDDGSSDGDADGRSVGETLGPRDNDGEADGTLFLQTLSTHTSVVMSTPSLQSLSEKQPTPYRYLAVPMKSAMNPALSSIPPATLISALLDPS